MIAYIVVMKSSKLTDMLVDNLVGVILLVILIPVILAQVNGVNMTLDIGGININLAIFLGVGVLVAVIAAISKMNKK